MNFTFTGTYRPCAACQGPVIVPAPPNHVVDLIKEGPPYGPVSEFYTPHTATCAEPKPQPAPGLALRVNGAALTTLEVW